MAIAKSVRRNCWIVGGVRPDRHVVFDGAAAPENGRIREPRRRLPSSTGWRPVATVFLRPSTGFGSVFVFIAGHRFGCGGLQLGGPFRNSTVSLSLAWAIWRAPAPRGRGRATPAP